MKFTRSGFSGAIWMDIRQVVRQIRKSALFSGVVILLLAAGLGTSTAIFSTVRAVLLTPLPYVDSERLVQIVSRWPKTGDQNEWSAPFRDALDWKATVPAFEDIAMYRYALLNLTDGSQPESLYGVKSTANLFPMLGIQPSIGRWFSAEEDRPDRTHVVILSYDLWRRRFDANPRIIGKVIHLNTEGYEVVGVMPANFNFPMKLAAKVHLPTDQMQFWIPVGADITKEQHGNPNAGVIARLKPSVPPATAAAELEGSCRVLETQYPVTNRGLSAALFSLRSHTVSQVNAPLLALLVATGLILLLTCANIAALLLAKGESNAHELAVRMALGGSFWQVARIPLLQGVILSLCGCLIAIPASAALLRLLISVSPINVPRLPDTRIDPGAIAFGIALSFICGLAVGGLNAFQVLKRSPREALSEGPKSSAGHLPTRLRSSLVIGQVALAVVLVAGAGLMLRTFINLLSVDAGYKPDHVIYAVNVLPPALYRDHAAVELFYKKTLDRLRASPGVQSAAIASGFPLVGQYNTIQVQAAPTKTGDTSKLNADFNEVSPGYIETLGIPVLRGRTIDDNDTAQTANVAVIDGELAKRLWPGQDPLGKLLNIDDPVKPVWRQVIGIIGQTRNRSLDSPPRPNIYIPAAQSMGGINFIVVKSQASPEKAAVLLKNIVSGVDPNQSVFFTQSMSDLVQSSIATRRFLFIALMFFATASLILSATGIYGLVSFIAASRSREVGIRIALGATRMHIAGLVVTQSLRLVTIGIASGLLGSLILSRSLSNLLFGISWVDIQTYLITALLLTFVSIVAAVIPAFRSALLPPMRALRY